MPSRAATRDLSAVAQRFGAQVQINALRSSFIQFDPRLPNPALDAGTYAAYLHLPEGGDLDSGSRLGTAINASASLQDHRDEQGGSLRVTGIEIHSIPESVLP
jgi:hypothetical protein